MEEQPAKAQLSLLKARAALQQLKEEEEEEQKEAEAIVIAAAATAAAARGITEAVHATSSSIPAAIQAPQPRACHLSSVQCRCRLLLQLCWW